MQKLTEENKKFIQKTIVFLFPLFFIYILLTLAGIASGELWPISVVVKYEASNPIGTLYSREVLDQEHHRYKYEKTIQKNPKILVLGSSRVMQFRQKMFEGESFYNAGGVISSMGDLSFLKEKLLDKINPDIILLGLDYYWFGEKANKASALKDNLSKKDAVYSWRSNIYSARNIIKEIYKNPSIIKNIFSREDVFSGKNAIGMQAIKGDGFRFDGSYQYATLISKRRVDPTYKDEDSTPVIERVKRGVSDFVFNDKLPEESLKDLEEFLAVAKKKGITVIGFSPPFSIEVHSELSTSSRYKDLFLGFKEEAELAFLKFGYYYFDFSSIKNLGVGNEYMFDGYHGTETLNALMLKDISQELPNLIPNQNFSYLENPETKPYEISW